MILFPQFNMQVSSETSCFLYHKVIQEFHFNKLAVLQHGQDDDICKKITLKYIQENPLLSFKVPAIKNKLIY